LIQEKEAEKRAIEDEAEAKQQKLWNILYACIFGGLLIIIIFIYRNYNEKKKANSLLSERNNIISIQNNEIKKQSGLLEEKNRDITDSIQYAKRLQDAILPDQNEMDQLLGDHFVLYKPKDIVSGDFYWFHDLSTVKQKKFLFAVVDCTGHGVPGGFVSIIGNNALHRAVNEFGLQRPAEILDKVSVLVENSFESKNEEIRDGMDMALIAMTFEKDLVKLEYSGANNPMWIVKRDEGQVKGDITKGSNGNSQITSPPSPVPSLFEMKADKQPIGKYEDRKPFTQHEMILSPGDSVYLFSDGYADQFGGPAGKKFKYAQLKEKFADMNGLNMKEQQKKLNEIILAWRGEMEQIDDICIFGIKI
jgi:serine phosphatase RsbU (regulator of sigma subunit)